MAWAQRKLDRLTWQDRRFQGNRSRAELGLDYRPDIDGLRALAVVPVVLFHAGSNIFSGGFVGVDVFFVISGYLITRLILADLRTEQFSFLRFYRRRIRRILPALSVVILASLAAGMLLFLPEDLKSLSTSAIFSALFSSNIYFMNTSGYFDAPAEFKPLLHTWSLSIEEQFYLVYPLLLFLLWSRWRRYWVLCVMGLAGLSLAYSAYLVPREPIAAFFSSPARAWELAIGAILAADVLPEIKNRVLREAACLLGVGLICYAVLAFTRETAFPGFNGLIPCLGTALLIHAGETGKTWTGRVLSSRSFVSVGKISYSLYLWHWPFLVFTRYVYANYLFEDASTVAIALAVVASAVLACLSWKYVEQPFRRTDGVVAQKLVVPLAASVAVCLIGVAGVNLATDGLSGRFDRKVLESYHYQEDYERGTCFLKEDQTFQDFPLDPCISVQPRGLIWGDSFAAQYVPGIRHELGSDLSGFSRATASGCPPIVGFATNNRPNCKPFNDFVLRELLPKHFDYVVLSADWPPQSVAELSATIDTVTKFGSKVILVGSTPRFFTRVPSIKMTYGFLGIGTSEAHAQINYDLDQAMRDLAKAKSVPYFAPTAVLCKGDTCTFERNDKLMFWDTGHLSAEGSKFVVNVLDLAKYFRTSQKP